MNSGAGDGHAYPGWYMDRSHTYWDFRDLPGGPFVTEFGAQALPGVESLKKTFRRENLWPPRLGAWRFHDFQPEQAFDVAGLKMGDSLSEFVAISQDYQARLIQFAVESYRRARYNPITGVFQFMFVENWPSVTWAVLDYWRVPKEGYWALRRAMQPVLASIEYDREVFASGADFAANLWAINDRPRPFPRVNLRWLLRLEGEVVRHGETPASLPEDSAHQILSLPGDDSLAPGAYALEAWLETPERERMGENRFIFRIEG
jgi:beta-mannosidase